MATEVQVRRALATLSASVAATISPTQLAVLATCVSVAAPLIGIKRATKRCARKMGLI